MFEQCTCFVVKVTRDCNLRCKYCYVADKDKYRNEKMSFSVFQTLVNRICLDKRKVNSNEEFSFIFHGGEPTVIGYETLNLFVHYAFHRFTEAKLKFRFGIQTNGTLLSPEILSLLHDYDFSIGMSFDGGIKTSNTARTRKSIKDYLKTIKSIRQIGINPGLLTVISKENLAFSKQNQKWLYKHGWNNGKWNYVEDVLNNGALEVTPEEFFSQVAVPVLKYLQKTKGQKFQESNLTNSILVYWQSKLQNFNTLDKQNSIGCCYIKFCGAGSRVLEISPDGQVNYCGRYARDDETSKCSNIFDTDFLRAASRKMFYRHIYLKHQLILEHHCDLCPAADLCDYGCLAFHYVKTGQFGIRTDLVCAYYKKLKQYFIEHEPELFEIYFNLKKTSRNKLYIRSKYEVTFEKCKELSRVIPKAKKYRYQIEPDPEFKSADGKCYQYLIVQKSKKKSIFNRKCR